jgi:hypothetical protein
MFMIVTFPWPSPKANAEIAGVQLAAAATRLPDAIDETGTLRPSRLEELVSWTWRERLRFRWYWLRLATGGIHRVGRAARESRLRVR